MDFADSPDKRSFRTSIQVSTEHGTGRRKTKLDDIEQSDEFMEDDEKISTGKLSQMSSDEEEGKYTNE